MSPFCGALTERLGNSMSSTLKKKKQCKYQTHMIKVCKFAMKTKFCSPD